LDGDNFARVEIKGEANGIDLVISAAKESLLEMCNIGKSIGVLFLPVLEVKAIGKDFCRGGEHVFEVEDSIDDKPYKNDSPKQVALSLLKVIFPPKVSNTLKGRKDTPSKNPYQNEGSKEFFSMNSDALSFGSKGLKWRTERLFDDFHREVGSSELLSHYEREKNKNKKNIKI
jgi:hypothetical protein